MMMITELLLEEWSASPVPHERRERVILFGFSFAVFFCLIDLADNELRVNRIAETRTVFASVPKSNPCSVKAVLHLTCLFALFWSPFFLIFVGPALQMIVIIIWCFVFSFSRLIFARGFVGVVMFLLFLIDCHCVCFFAHFT